MMLWIATRLIVEGLIITDASAMRPLVSVVVSGKKPCMYTCLTLGINEASLKIAATVRGL